MKILIKKNKLTGPADPKLHDLHDTAQQQENYEESQWGTTGFLPDQWVFAMNPCR